MLTRLLLLTILFACVSLETTYCQVVRYGNHTKDTTFQKQIVDSLSLSTEFFLNCTPQKPVYQYNFVYSMSGRKSQEVGDNTKPQFLASTKSVHSIEFKPNSVNNYDCLLTCSPLSLFGSQITNIGTLKDSSFKVPGYETKRGTFQINNSGIITNFSDNYETVLSDPGITRIRSLFIEDIDRKFLRFVIPKYPSHPIEIGDEWNVTFIDSTKTITQPLIFTYNLLYKVLSLNRRDEQQIITIEFKSNNSKIYQKNYPDTEFEVTMEVDEAISGVYEIDKRSGLPIKLTLKSRIELVSKDFKQRVVDAKRIDQTYEYTLL